MSAVTESDFSKARRKAFINEIQHFLNPENAAMISFKTVRQMLKPQNETYVGLQTIPIAKIIGSEGRWKDFDNQFFPKNTFMRERWIHVDEAAINDVILPPIKVYE
nr:transcriptional regulator [Treponemataceae bacterium]